MFGVLEYHNKGQAGNQTTKTVFFRKKYGAQALAYVREKVLWEFVTRKERQSCNSGPKCNTRKRASARDRVRLHVTKWLDTDIAAAQRLCSWGMGGNMLVGAWAPMVGAWSLVVS